MDLRVENKQWDVGMTYGREKQSKRWGQRKVGTKDEWTGQKRDIHNRVKGHERTDEIATACLEDRLSSIIPSPTVIQRHILPYKSTC